MADNHLEGSGVKKADDHKDEVHQKLLDDTTFSKYINGADNSDQLSGMTSSPLGRSTYAMLEGLSQTPHGLFKAVQHDINHPQELLAKAAGGAAFGIGLRLLLPKEGAAKALVGTAMSYFFITDAARPIIHTWQDAGNANSMTDVHAAATRMGDGLGHFAVDSAIAVGTGALAEMGTGALLNRSATGRNYEVWKDRQFNSESTAMGRFFNWSERTADGMSGAVAEKLLGRDAVFADLPIEQKLKLIREANEHCAAEIKAKATALDQTLETRKKFRSEDFSIKIDGLLEGQDLNIQPAGPGALAHGETVIGGSGPAQNQLKILKLTEGGTAEGPLGGPRKGEFPRPMTEGKGELPVPTTETGGIKGETKAPAPTEGGGTKGDSQAPAPTEGGGTKGDVKAPAPEGGGTKGDAKAPAPESGGNKGDAKAPAPEGGGNKGDAKAPTETGDTPVPRPPGGPKGEAPTPTDAGKPTDAIVIGDKPVPVVGTKGEIGSENVGNMAVAMRESSGAVTKEDIAVAQVVEDMKGPILSTMRGGKAPLDAGHFSNNEMLAALADQVSTADEVRQVGALLDHFRTANQQVELSVNREHGGLPEILDLNQYSRSIHAQLLTALDKNGIPRSVVRGSNSPMFTIRDSDGAGPYTIPAIKGVNDAAVITYPREYQGKSPSMPNRPSMVGTHTPGVYPHELGHDLIYGDLAKFPEQSRSGWLNDKVVSQAMKDKGIDDVVINVPGAPGGTMKKSEFFVQLLKAQANENTADMFGSSIDPNTGLSLAVLLGSLRKPGTANAQGPGMLETRSMYGKELIDERMENGLGIEPHGLDRWRIKLAAETLRHVSGRSENVVKYAAELDGLADSMARPGTQYVWANMDEPGKFVAIPMKEWDAIIPTLVKAQFETPLATLNNKTLRDLAPNMAERFGKIETLAQATANAALRGETTVAGFDKGTYRIEEVVSSGLSGWMKAIESNKQVEGSKITAGELMDRVNRINEKLRTFYRDDVPELSVPGPKAPVSLASVATRPLGIVANAAGQAARFQPHLRERFVRHAGSLTSYAGVSLIGPPLSSSITDLMEHKRVELQILNQGDTNK